MFGFYLLPISVQEVDKSTIEYVRSVHIFDGGFAKEIDKR
jgi:hypothetical protein